MVSVRLKVALVVFRKKTIFQAVCVDFPEPKDKKIR